MNEPDRDAPIGERDLLRWSEALAGIARTGLGFTDNDYERERFEEVLHVAAEIRHATTRGFDPGEQVQDWLTQVGRGVPGYVTPKATVGAVVANSDDEILLVQRADSGIWLYPTGWADIGYSASEVAVKEVREETGIVCEVERVLAVLDGLRLGFTGVPLYSVVFLCRAVGGEIDPHPLECLDAGFFAEDAMPHPTAGVDHWGVHAFSAIRGHDVPVMYDPPRNPAWLGQPDTDPSGADRAT